MNNRVIESDSVPFEAEGWLLQELGERLVANPAVALVELIKNAYDADATTCTISVETDDTGAQLVIADDGFGMTKFQFLNHWMKIATAHKRQEPVSPNFGRHRTGQKGIGRFAVRYLGANLVLTTTADDPTSKVRTRLTATFDWSQIDAAQRLEDTPIRYTLEEVDEQTTPGTRLQVGRLRHDLVFLESKNFRTEVLRIVSPLNGLDGGRSHRSTKGNGQLDPGLQVKLPGASGEEVDIAEEILSRAWARLQIKLLNRKAQYAVHVGNMESPRTLDVAMKTHIKGGLVADIRHFPRRQGIFSGISVDGRTAWSWVRENCGVAVIDHGFRIRPYGFKYDDWLHLDLDSSHNERDWRTDIAKREFPIPPEIKARPGENPALNLPSNFQVVGAVFLESQGASTDDDLTVATDREGFLHNEAYAELVEIVRGGIEFLALVDKEYLEKEQERKAAEVLARTREDFHAAIENIQNSPTLSPGDKNRLTTHYGNLSAKLQEVEEYNKDARRKLETMGLLGVVAGFMTHEAARILDGLDRALQRLRTVARKDAELGDAIGTVEEGYSAFKAHVEYTSLFIDAMHRQTTVSFKARAQVDHIIQRFGAFARERNLECSNEIEDDVRVTGVPIAAYSGVLLNLYTNAIKAVLAREGGADGPQIVFRGWNEPRYHVIEVLDKGIGVPPELRQRVFDPLFTTTSSVNNPLGSGMGLGLSLVKEVVGHTGGKLRLVDAPAGFSTCFRAQFGGTT